MALIVAIISPGPQSPPLIAVGLSELATGTMVTPSGYRRGDLGDPV
jgi:hypothetical protein